VIELFCQRHNLSAVNFVYGGDYLLVYTGKLIKALFEGA